MKIKNLLHLFAKHLRSIPLDVPLYAEEMFLKPEDDERLPREKRRLESRKLKKRD